MVADWLAAAGDVAFAFVSSRSNDDRELVHRIVVGAGPADRPSHILHAPSGRDIRIVFALGRRTKVGQYVTLRAALNSIRPVLDTEPAPIAAR